MAFIRIGRNGRQTPPDSARGRQRIIAAAGYLHAEPRRRSGGFAMSERIAAERDLRRMLQSSNEREETLILYGKLVEAVRRFGGEKIALQGHEPTTDTEG